MRDKLRYFLTLKLLISIIGNRFLGCHAMYFFSTLCDRYDVLSHLFVWSTERTYVSFAQPLPISLGELWKKRGGKGQPGRDGHGESVCRYAFLFYSI